VRRMMSPVRSHPANQGGLVKPTLEGISTTPVAAASHTPVAAASTTPTGGVTLAARTITTAFPAQPAAATTITPTSQVKVAAASISLAPTPATACAPAPARQCGSQSNVNLRSQTRSPPPPAKRQGVPLQPNTARPLSAATTEYTPSAATYTPSAATGEYRPASFVGATVAPVHSYTPTVAVSDMRASLGGVQTAPVNHAALPTLHGLPTQMQLDGQQADLSPFFPYGDAAQTVEPNFYQGNLQPMDAFQGQEQPLDIYYHQQELDTVQHPVPLEEDSVSGNQFAYLLSSLEARVDLMAQMQATRAQIEKHSDDMQAIRFGAGDMQGEVDGLNSYGVDQFASMFGTQEGYVNSVTAFDGRSLRDGMQPDAYSMVPYGEERQELDNHNVALAQENSMLWEQVKDQHEAISRLREQVEGMRGELHATISAVEAGTPQSATRPTVSPMALCPPPAPCLNHHSPVSASASAEAQLRSLLDRNQSTSDQKVQLLQEHLELQREQQKLSSEQWMAERDRLLKELHDIKMGSTPSRGGGFGESSMSAQQSYGSRSRESSKDRRSGADDFRRPSFADEIRRPSVADDFRRPSVADDLRRPSVGDDLMRPCGSQGLGNRALEERMMATMPVLSQSSMNSPGTRPLGSLGVLSDSRRPGGNNGVSPFSQITCGTNIKLSEDGFTASRVRGCRQSLAIGSLPLQRQELGWYFEVEVKETVAGWVGGLGIGISQVSPSDLKRVPDKAWRMPNTYMVGYWGCVFLDGRERRTKWRADTLEAGSRVGLLVTGDGHGDLIVFVDDQPVVRADGAVPVGRGSSVESLYPVVDVFAATLSVALQPHARAPPPPWNTNPSPPGSPMSVSQSMRSSATASMSTRMMRPEMSAGLESVPERRL